MRGLDYVGEDLHCVAPVPMAQPAQAQHGVDLAIVADRLAGAKERDHLLIAESGIIGAHPCDD